MSDVRMAGEIASAAYIVNDKALVDGKTKKMFDKIINVKFIRKNADRYGNNSFSIRSDYEAIRHKDNTISFVKCSPKPSIKVTYNQVSGSTAISVKIRIEGLFIDREIAGEEIDSAGGNPVVWAVLQLGYFDDFPKWDQAKEDDDIARFFDLNNNTLSSDDNVLAGKQLQVQILSCYPESTPPDRVWVFNGVVATLENGLRWNHTQDDLIAGYGNKMFPAGLSKIEAMFFQWITRRFIRSSVEHTVLRGSRKLEDGTEVADVRIFVRGYNKYIDTSSEDNSIVEIEVDNDGLMKPSDAEKLGVLCTCSELLRSMDAGDVAQFGLLGESAESSLVGASADYSLFDEPMQTIGAQIQAIKRQFSYLRWYPLMDGNFFFYHVNQATEDIFKDPEVKQRQLDGVIKLPAVYDITMSGERIIRCPFIRFINPMTTVLFQSRYRILDQTGYYYQPARQADASLVLLASNEFATNDEDNMMVLTAVDILEEDAPDVDFGTGIVVPKVGTARSVQDYTTAVPRGREERSKAWAKAVITIGVYPYASANLRWVDIARHLQECAKPDDWGGVLPTIAKALEDLKAWNDPTAFDDGVWTDARLENSGELSPENNLVPGLPFGIPWLYTNDKVVIRQPYKATYDTAFEQKEIKVNG